MTPTHPPTHRTPTPTVERSSMESVAHVSNVTKDITLVVTESAKECPPTADCSILKLDYANLALLDIKLLMDYASPIQPIQPIRPQIRILDARHGPTISV